MTLEVAIVGCGKIADGHVEELQKMPDVARIVGVCDREPLMAEQLATRYGLDFHTDDLEHLLRSRSPDVVHITTPPASHLALGMLAIDAGCHVYVEKPMTTSFEDTRALVEHAAARRKKITVGYTYLFDPAALELRAVVASGALGEVVHVESHYGYDLAGTYGAAILADPGHWVLRLPGQLLHNNLDHVLNKTLDVVDDERPRIAAHGFVRRAARFGDARDEVIDELRVIIQGAKATAYGTFSSHVRPLGHHARVYGTKDTAYVDYVARTVTLESTGALPSAVGRLYPPFAKAARMASAGLRNVSRFAQADFHFFAGLHTLLRSFYRCIERAGPEPIPHRDMLRAAWMVDEVVRQLGAGPP